MNCVVTAGPTYETMDNVRRHEFFHGPAWDGAGQFLTARGHDVTLLIGEQAKLPANVRRRGSKFTRPPLT